MPRPKYWLTPRLIMDYNFRGVSAQPAIHFVYDGVIPVKTYTLTTPEI